MKLIGAILAGGQSRRMGQDKALLPIGDSKTGATTLLECMLDKLQGCALFDEIVICRDPAAQRPARLEDTTFLADLVPDRGPLGGLYTLAQHHPSQRAIVVPVDMPLLDGALFSELLHVAGHASVIHYEGHYFPLLIEFNKAVHSRLESRIFSEDRNYALAALLEEVSRERISVAGNQQVFSNINTMEQWQALH